MRSDRQMTVKPLVRQQRNSDKGEHTGDGDIYGTDDQLELNEAFWAFWDGRQEAKRQLRNVAGGNKSSASQPMGQGQTMPQGAENAQVLTAGDNSSGTTHLTGTTVASQAQSLQESLAQSMVQMSKALVASAAQTQAMLAQGVGRLPVLKLDGRGRPKVKAVKTWIKDIGDKKFSVKGFTATLDLLRKKPERVSRDDFAEIYITMENDRAMYQQVK